MTNPAEGSFDSRSQEDCASVARLAARVERLERELRASEAIHGLQTDLAEADSLDTVWDLTLDFLEMMPGIDWGRLLLIESESIIPGTGDSPGEQEAVGYRLALRAVKTGRTQHFPDPRAGFRTEFTGSRIYTLVQLAAPIQMAVGVVGVIILGRAREKPLTDEDTGIVETVSEHVADALERIIRSRIGSARSLSLEYYL